MADGFDFCRDPGLGFEGDAFIAEFGDLAPITTISKATIPAGFKVVRLELASGQVYDFATIHITAEKALNSKERSGMHGLPRWMGRGG